MYTFLKNNLTGDRKIHPEVLLKTGKLEELKRLDLAGEIDLGSWSDPKTSKTLLHIASEFNQIEAIKFLAPISQINARDSQGNTALHKAVQNVHTGALCVLLEHKADITVANSRNRSPLHIALGKSNQKALDLVGVIISHPVFDTVLANEHYMYTCLKVIVERDNVKVLELLCKKIKEARESPCTVRSVLLEKDQNGVTLMHLAARQGSHNVMQLLFSLATDTGLSHNELTGAVSYEKRTPLHYAVENDHFESVRVLLEHGADSTSLNGSHSPPVHRACRKDTLNMLKLMVEICGREILLACDKQGRNAYHSSALSTCSKKVITYLVENGVPVDAEDYSSFSPLANAILLGATTAVDSLLQNGADPLAKDKSGHNALHLAIAAKRYDIFEIVIASEKANDMLEDYSFKGLQPIHYALKIGHIGMLNHLLPLLKTELKDEEGNNYVHNAVLSKNSKTLPHIFKYPFAQRMTNEPNLEGLTPLHLAASESNPTAARMLIENGAIIHKCHKGLTPFMYGCLEGNLETSKVLFAQNKLQKNWTDHRGNTALHFAVDGKNHAIVTYCLDKETPVTLNDDNITFFDKIIDKKELQLAEAVFQHERWEECLDNTSPSRPHSLIRTLEEIPEAYGALLDSCFSRSNHDPAHYDYWEEYNFKSVTLSVHRGHTRKSCQNESNKDDFEMDMLMEDEHIVEEEEKLKEMDDASCEPEQKWKCFVNRDKRPLGIIRKLVYSNHKLYLLHPVVEAFVRARWNGIHGAFYLVKIIFHFLLALLFTVFLTTAPKQVMKLSNNSTSISQRCCAFPSTARIFLLVAILIILFLSTFIFLIEVIHRYRNIREILKEAVVWMNFMALLFTTVYVATELTGSANLRVWNIAAVAVTFTWLSVGFDLQIINTLNIGVYITILMSTSRVIFKVLLIIFFLFLAFAAPLYLLVGNETSLDFTSFGLSIFSIFTSLLAIIDVSQIIELEQNGKLEFPILVFMLLVVILVLLPIITINVLIGLAVGNIELIQKNAVLTRRAVEIRALSHLDFIEFPWLYKRYSRPIHRYYPNRRKSAWQWMTYQLYQQKGYKLYAEESEKSVSTVVRQIMAEEREVQDVRIEKATKKLEDMVAEQISGLRQHHKKTFNEE